MQRARRCTDLRRQRRHGLALTLAQGRIERLPERHDFLDGAARRRLCPRGRARHPRTLRGASRGGARRRDRPLYRSVRHGADRRDVISQQPLDPFCQFVVCRHVLHVARRGSTAQHHSPPPPNNYSEINVAPLPKLSCQLEWLIGGKGGARGELGEEQPDTPGVSQGVSGLPLRASKLQAEVEARQRTATREALSRSGRTFPSRVQATRERGGASCAGGCRDKLVGIGHAVQASVCTVVHRLRRRSHREPAGTVHTRAVRCDGLLPEILHRSPLVSTA